MNIRSYFRNLLCVLFVLAFLSGCNNKSEKNITEPNATIVSGSENTILIPMLDENGKWGFVDENKNWIIDPQYYDVRMFDKGMATAYITKDKAGIINTNNQWIIKPKYEIIGSLDNGYFFAAYKDKPVMIIDENENVAVDGLIDESIAALLTDNLVPVNKVGVFDNEQTLIGFKNHKNEWVVQPKYISYTLFNDGYAVVRNPDSTQIVIDTLGNTVLSIPSSIKLATQYGNGLIPILSDKKWGYMNIDGNIIIEPKFEVASNFVLGLAIIIENGVYNIIDTKGDFVLSLSNYDNIGITSNGYIEFTPKEDASHKGIMDIKGNIIIPPLYTRMIAQNKKFFRAIDDSGKVSYIDINGNKYTSDK